ncbi:MAG TPA: hypothetical protein VGF98_14650 [Candidatus Tumulicola sp.]|jgi:hypothetical protein
MSQALWAEFKAGLPSTGNHATLAQRFTDALLREVLGFGGVEHAIVGEVDGNDYPLAFYGAARVPVAIAAASEGLDTPSSRFGDGTRRRSAFGLVQEYLNGPHASLWGMATDGIRLRLLRENASMTRPTWIEVDLERLFSEERFADFVPLWLLIHDSRFGALEAMREGSWLEAWRIAGRDDGTRARDKLRDGVEAALVVLGQAFLANRDNRELRQSLEDGTLSTQTYFQELLRLVYRLIFLLTIEERDLLHPPDCSTSAKALYAKGYGLRALRERSSRRAARDRFTDLWQALKIVFRGAAHGEARLAIPALGGLFADDQCQTLDAAKLENWALLEAVFRLGWLREESGIARVNWRDMGPEELGSIYESLLDLRPQLSIAGRSFEFAGKKEAKGNARKLSSSFYTHDNLVQTLLDAAIEPIIDSAIAKHPADASEAILRLAVVDPACGSGHFLLGAARRLGSQVARLRANGTPSLSEYREALRLVISSCIYGVDRNPMAVELCKAALWIETVVPGRPLSFLDSHIRCGDALLGVLDLAQLDRGIPAEAFEAREGDDRAVAKALRLRNKQRIEDINTLPLFAAAATAHSMELLPEDTVEQVKAKRTALAAAEAEPSMVAARQRANLVCAAFFVRKTKATESQVPLTSDVDKLAIGEQSRAGAVAVANELAGIHNFFHWPLMFPDVFARGGFHLVLGNPPWKPMSPDAKEFFAPLDPSVRDAAPADQERLIADLLLTPGLQSAWDEHCRTLYDTAAFIKESGRFSMFAEGNLGKGDFNVYRMFVETALCAVRAEGIAAQLVPENLYNGANAAALRATLFNDFNLLMLIGFQNTRNIWFPAVYHRTKFCMYVARREPAAETFLAAFGVNTLAKLEAARAGRAIKYPLDQVRESSPDALAVTEIMHPSDVAIVQKLYARFPKFGVDGGGLAARDYARELDMGNDRESFGNDPTGLPLYEGRMVAAFDHRAKAYVSGRARSAHWKELIFGADEKSIKSQWRVASGDLPRDIAERCNQYRLGFCDVASPTNARTLVAALIPTGVVCGQPVPTITFSPNDPRLTMLWLGVANAICVDYLARKKVSLHMTFSYMDSLPLPRQFESSALEVTIAAKSLKLTATGAEMAAFWTSTALLLGMDPDLDQPCEDFAERERLRSELDVLVARDVFGLNRDEMLYLLEPSAVLGPECDFETFGPLRRNEEKMYGEFRTGRLILETWDALPSPDKAPRRA